jgi:HEAT repeat protein
MDDAKPNSRGLLAERKEALTRALLLVLTRELQSESASARRKAAHCLASLGPAARQAVPLLERLVRDQDYRVRTAAREALARISGDAADAS